MEKALNEVTTTVTSIFYSLDEQLTDKENLQPRDQLTLTPQTCPPLHQISLDKYLSVEKNLTEKAPRFETSFLLPIVRINPYYVVALSCANSKSQRPRFKASLAKKTNTYKT